MLQYPSLQLMQLRTGFEAKLINQAPTGRLEGAERVSLAPGAIQSEHHARDQPLPQRVLLDEPLELGHQLGAVAERELRLEPRLKRAQPELLKSPRVGLESFGVEQVAPRRPAPHRERDRQLAQCRFMVSVLSRGACAGDESLEFGNVELPWLDAQRVAARLAFQTVMAEQLPQPVNVRVERLSGAPRCPLPPQRVVFVINGAACDATDTSLCGESPATVDVGASASFGDANPFGIAVDDGTDTIYTANIFHAERPGTVSVINGAICNGQDMSGCEQTPATAPAGFGASGIATDQLTNQVYVTNIEGTSVTTIDGATCNGTNATSCNTRTEATVGDYPNSISVDAAVGTAYVADIEGVSVIPLNH